MKLAPSIFPCLFLTLVQIIYGYLNYHHHVCKPTMCNTSTLRPDIQNSCDRHGVSIRHCCTKCLLTYGWHCAVLKYHRLYWLGILAIVVLYGGALSSFSPGRFYLEKLSSGEVFIWEALFESRCFRGASLCEVLSGVSFIRKALWAIEVKSSPKVDSVRHQRIRNYIPMESLCWSWHEHLGQAALSCSSLPD